MDEHDTEREIDVACRQLGIALAPEWTPLVRAHLEAIRAAMAFVDALPLPDEAEQAPQFEA